MNFSFHSPDFGPCVGRLWATGRYGFSLPKKVDIVTPDGSTYTYLYFNKRVTLKEELANRTIVRIAVAQFLMGDGASPATTAAAAAPIELDPDLPPYAGPLTPSQAAMPRTPLRVRPGKLHARPAIACEAG